MDTEYDAMPNGRVLVVDNKDMSLYIARGILSLYGLLIDTAKSGYEAIEKIKYNVYDLVIMDHDHMMPEMDGMKTTRKVRRLKGGYKKLPIVALTANTADGTKEMFLAGGFNGYIPKPIALLEMDKILKEWLPPEKISRRARATELASSPIDNIMLSFNAPSRRFSSSELLKSSSLFPATQYCYAMPLLKQSV
jgi:CheY-like chemotaxis protein